jgi:hypothetical protein
MGGIDLATLGADDLLIRGARLSEGSSDGAKPLYREGERGSPMTVYSKHHAETEDRRRWNYW